VSKKSDAAKNSSLASMGKTGVYKINPKAVDGVQMLFNKPAHIPADASSRG
jgi:hypothetical protein